MIDKIQSLIRNIKLNFQDYLIEKNRSELLDKLDELFDYEVKEINNVVKVSLHFKDQVIFQEDILLTNFKDLPQKIQHSVRMIFNDELLTTFNLVYNDKNVFKQDLKIGDIKQIKTVLQKNRKIIFNKIGTLDVQLQHNDTKELCSFKLNISNFKDIITSIKKNEEDIYKNYIDVDLKKQRKYYGEGDSPTPPIVEILNPIVDEFDNYLSDENGNIITWA